MNITQFVSLPKPKKGGQPGNNNSAKWKTKEERQEACAKIILELKNGKPKEYLMTANWETILDYMEKFPFDFASDSIHDAIRQGKSAIIATGYQGMQGKIANFNANTWKFVVMNMTGWKIKNDVTSDDAKIESPILYIPNEKE